MSKYTTELRTLIENHFDIGLKDYPIFDESYRDILNAKIIEHYFFREIGFETAELFKRFLNRTLNEIMPFYNQLYKSELIEFNPMHNYDKYEENQRGTNTNTDFNGWATDKQTENGTSKSTADTTGKTDTTGNGTNNTTVKTTGTIKTETDNLNVDSDAPQGMLSIGNIKGNTYASKANMLDGTQRVVYDENGVPYTVTTNGTNTDTGTTTTTGKTETNGQFQNEKNGEGKSGTNTQQKQDEWINRHFYGKSEGVSYSEMLLKYRETFLNIDMLIINELETCFMMIY